MKHIKTSSIYEKYFISTILKLVGKLFSYYKSMGDQVMDRLSLEELYTTPHAESNSAFIIVRHLHGNMLSRWTDFLHSDGEKTWRNRDQEFETMRMSKDDMISLWDTGWSCLFDALNALDENDLTRIVYIRNEGHTVVEAIQRQLAHYAYHVGQLVYIGKMIKQDQWQSLSIARNESTQYNQKKNEAGKNRSFFTDKL